MTKAPGSAPKLCITIGELSKLKPCADDGRRVRAALRKLNCDPGYCFDAAAAREAGCSYSEVIWVASAIAMDDDEVARRLTYFVNDCAIKVLHIFEDRAPEDQRPRLAIKATLGFLAGRVSDEEWERASKDARDAWAAWAARDAWAAWDAWAARAAWAARDAWDAWAARAAWDAWAAWAARDAWDAWAARDAWAAWAAWDEAAKKFEAWQFDRLILWLGETPPKPLRLPAAPKAAGAKAAA